MTGCFFLCWMRWVLMVDRDSTVVAECCACVLGSYGRPHVVSLYVSPLCDVLGLTNTTVVAPHLVYVATLACLGNTGVTLQVRR